MQKEESKIYYGNDNILNFQEKEWNRYRGKECSMIFQDALSSLNPTMKIGKQILKNLDNHYPDMPQQEKGQRVLGILEEVGIRDAKNMILKYPHQLSGGMRQRVMIAMAMITNPKILIADEATTALDVTIQAQILNIMKNLKKENDMTILFITHNLGIVADIADYIFVMYAGKILEKGTPEDIFYHTKNPYTWALLRSVPRIDMGQNEKLPTIEGNIPDLQTVTEGCPFYERCPYAMHVCKNRFAPETDWGEGHINRCWLDSPDSDRTDVPFYER